MDLKLLEREVADVADGQAVSPAAATPGAAKDAASTRPSSLPDLTPPPGLFAPAPRLFDDAPLPEKTGTFAPAPGDRLPVPGISLPEAVVLDEPEPAPAPYVRPLTPLIRLFSHMWFVGIVVAALLVQSAHPGASGWRLPAGLDLASLQVASAASDTTARVPGTAPGGVMRAPILPSDSTPGDRLVRAALPQTLIPERPRRDVITYTVVSGDTLFGIAYQFGLQPETILWSNPDLQDNPHLLSIDQTLNILPINGVYHTVTVSDTLNSIAEDYKVEPDAIQNAFWNQPYIGKGGGLTVGANLVVPGGQKKFVVWVLPPPNPGGKPGTGNGTANVGSCGATPGFYGTGYFIWPTEAHCVSGNPYAPWHMGVDLRATYGANIYAADNGTVVFAGWSTVGYGNLVVIDHGNGWQTWYAHLSTLYVVCGQNVWQGGVIGLAGSTGHSTGPHLHFETRWQGTLPNPLDVLPPP